MIEEGVHETFFSPFFFTSFQANSVTATIGVTLGHYTLETSVASAKGTPLQGRPVVMEMQIHDTVRTQLQSR